MNLLPVITRELRAEARNTANYGLRLLAVIALAFFVGMIFWSAGAYFLSRGREVFAIISAMTFFGIWILTPLLASDCLSRERREGTLGLLFLTPLRPLEIVLGKGFIHFLRGLTLIVATIPVLTIPFLLGGVTASDLLRVLFLYGTALFLSLAAGLLASSFCQSWMRSVVLTVLILVLFAFFFVYLPVAFPRRGFNALFRFMSDWDNVLEWLFFLNGGRIPFLPKVTPLFMSGILCLMSALVFVGVMFFAARRLRLSWQEEPPSARQVRLHKIFLTPRFLPKLFRWSNNWRLSRNPVGWLQQYSWSARLSKWGWCLLIVVMDCWCVMDNYNDIEGWLGFLTFLLLISMAFSAVSSFQREKQTGALELLLVTPLREKQIISGRLWGIWTQFFPALVVLMASIFYTRARIDQDDMVGFFEMARAFLLVPVVGLYFALRLKNVVAAWLVTASVYALLPMFLMWASDWLSGKMIGRRYGFNVFFSDADLARWIIFAVLSTILTGIAARLLYLWLKQRSFALGKS